MNIFGVIFIVLLVLHTVGVYNASILAFMFFGTLWVIWGCIKFAIKIAAD